MSKQNTPALAAALVLIVCLRHSRADVGAFGIMPKEQHVLVSSQTDVKTWQLRFKSLSEYINAIRQPSFETLASGETDAVYYVFFRAKSDILIFDYLLKKGDAECGQVNLTDPEGGQAMYDTAIPRPEKTIDLLDTDLEAASSSWANLFGLFPLCTYSHFGWAYQIKHGYSGPLKVKLQVWNEGRNNPPAEAAPTVNWNSTP
jgi:hypothetical protein